MKNKTALKGGTYSIVLTTIVLAILAVVNIFAQRCRLLQPSMISVPRNLFYHKQHKSCCKCFERGCDEFTGSYRMVRRRCH